MADKGLATEIKVAAYFIDQLPKIENAAEVFSLAAEVAVAFKWKSKSEVQPDQ